MTKRYTLWFQPVLACLLLAGLLGAQGTRGTITGTVNDASGAVVPGAEITILEKATGVETKSVTSEAGVYRAPYLSPGIYRVTVALKGFKTAIRDNVQILVTQTVNLDFTLELGEVTDEITVSAEAPLLESGSSEIGTNTTEKEVHTWPIQVGDGTRQLQNFIFTSLPGTQGESFLGSVNGGQGYSHEILIDGISIGRFDLNGGNNNEFTPTLDAVSEFKLQTGALSSQFGNTQTALVNFGLKSGTNDFHGGAFWLHQNAGLNALNWSPDALDRPPARPLLHNFGATVGGPVIKDKTHFFFSYEGNRLKDYTVGSGRDTLPIDAFKQGDFSRLLNPAFTLDPRSGTTVGTDALGRPIVFGQIYDPGTSRQLADGTWIRDPFPGNIIPQSRFSTVSRNVLNNTLPGPQFDLFRNNNPRGAAGQPVLNIDNWGLKIDHVLNSSHKVQGSYTSNDRYRYAYNGDRYPGIPIPGPAAANDRLQATPGWIVRFSEDWTLSANKLNHFGFGYNRFRNNNQNNAFLSGKNWATELGLKGVTGATFPVATFGQVGGTVFSGGYRQYGGAGTGSEPNGSTILQDDFTWIRGKHSFKVGGEHRRYYLNYRSVTGSGTYAFHQENTSLPGSFFNQTGFAYASFLLGEVRSANVGIVNLTPGTRARTTAFYVQDDWKVTSKLTFNLGVRWDIPQPYKEAANRLAGLDPTKPNPGADGFPGAFVMLGDGPGRTGATSFTDTYYGEVGPRVGFAYAASEKLVIRGGYGINYAPNLQDGFNFPYYVGFDGSNPIIQRTGRFREDASYRWDGTYPPFTAVLPDTDPTLLNGQDIGYYLPETKKFPMVQNWNIGVQTELPWKTRLEANYIGNKSKRLNTQYNSSLNQVDPKYLSLGDALLDDINDHPEIKKPYPSFEGSVGQALRPFPQYQTISTHRTNIGRGDYHSLQVTASRRSGDLSYLAAYTWSRSRSDSDSAIGGATYTGGYGQDFYNLKADFGVTTFHRPHDLKLTWIYEFPFGPQHQWAKTGVLSRVIGGWTMSGIQRYTSGVPLHVSADVFDTSGLFNNGFYADIKLPKEQWTIGSKPTDPDIDRGTPYLNPAAFGPPPSTASGALPTRFGNAGRFVDGLRGFATWSEDFSLLKRTDLGFREGALFEIRMDVTNIFNRTGINDPNTDAGDPASFGRIFGKYGAGRRIQVGARFTF